MNNLRGTALLAGPVPARLRPIHRLCLQRLTRALCAFLFSFLVVVASAPAIADYPAYRQYYVRGCENAGLLADTRDEACRMTIASTSGCLFTGGNHGAYVYGGMDGNYCLARTVATGVINGTATYSTGYSCPYGGTRSGSVCTGTPQCPAGQVRNTITQQCQAPDVVAASRAKQSGGSCPTTGHPISLGGGNKSMHERDLLSGSVSAERSYNSLSAQLGYPALVTGLATGVMPLGLGWSVEYQQQIRISPSSSSTAWSIRPSGRVFTFQLSGTTWNPEADVADRLTELKDVAGTRTGWQYRDAAAERAETFDASGKLQSVRERNGRVETVVYADGTDGSVSGDGGFVSDASGNPTTTVLPSGRLLRVQDDFGRKLVFGTDADGRIVKITSTAGDAVRYGYDTANQLTSVIYPGGAVRAYHYNESAYTGGANLPGALTGITDENGERYATYLYDSEWRAVGEHLAGGADAALLGYTQDLYQNVTQTAYTDALGTTRTYAFETKFGVTRPTGVSQPGGPGCAASSSSITYDGNANVASRADFAGNKTCYAHDLSRNVELVRVEGLAAASVCPATPVSYAPAGIERKVSTLWHPLWRLKVREAQPKKITTWVYNGQPDPTAGGAIASCAPSDAHVYDTVPIAVLCKQVEQPTTDATGGAGFAAASDGTARTWSYTWNRHGQMLTANGPRTDVADITTYEYYPDTTANWTQGDLKFVTNALNQSWQFTQYDAAGRLLAMTDPNGVVTTQTWYPRGWLASRSTGTATTAWTYHPTGLLQRVTLPDGRYLDYTWDDAHRLTDVTDALGNRTHHTLDAAGNILHTEVSDAGDALARQARVEFDPLGRHWKQRNATDDVTERQHDPLGRLNKLIDAKSRETDYRWDALGRLHEIEDAQQPARGLTLAQYDGQDRLTQLTAPNGAVTQFTVDGLGEVTQESGPDRGTLTYVYDAAGNVTRRTDALGRITDYSWDALDRPTSVAYHPAPGAAASETVIYTWDSAPGCAYGLTRLCSVGDGAGTTLYSYNDTGHLVQESRTEAGAVHATQYVRDLAGQVLQWIDPARTQRITVRDGAGRTAMYVVAHGAQAEWVAGTLHHDAAGVLDYAAFGAEGLAGTVGLSTSRDSDGRLVSQQMSAALGMTMDVSWTRSYAGAGNALPVSITLGPEQVRGTLVVCRAQCQGADRLATYAIASGGIHSLALDTLARGVHRIHLRFEANAPFMSVQSASRLVFIGIPPSQFIENLLP
jgi:YD repeat-containing protein